MTTDASAPSPIVTDAPIRTVVPMTTGSLVRAAVAGSRIRWRSQTAADPEVPLDEERRPRSVYGVGDEPDPRFTLANERTALAWMRTALALVGGGVAIVSLASLPDLPRWTAGVGAVACVAGAVIGIRTVQGWAHTERALRLREPLPAPRTLPLLAGGIVVLGAVALVLSVIELLRSQ